ncbi:sulfotransferase 2B1 [Caerostris darwini]|uniref:Sulfotransferase 2B1 n=1 Tax=Caerostris darwini TaxID=1538125 RepID=A0AAV4PZU5_9ARAC|nr:sulfotransferase 2B1 [Caerostris darwini]
MICKLLSAALLKEQGDRLKSTDLFSVDLLVRQKMTKKPRYIEIDGIPCSSIDVPEVYRDAMRFKPGKGDTVIVTYPKCGTTWLLQIVSLILRKGEPLVTYKEYFSYIPFLERTTVKELSQMPKPRLMKTHLSIDRLNFSSEAKYIYVARHPADCVVSYYHHTRLFPTYFFTRGKLDDFFELFLTGEVAFGDYFDHLLAGYLLRNEPNVLFLTFESLLSNPRDICLKVARFMGEEHYNNLMADDEVILKKVLEYSSMKFMKSTVNDFWMRKFTDVPSQEAQDANPVMRNVAKFLKEAEDLGEESTGVFFRSGVGGEGKATLSAEQLERLRSRILEKTKNSDVMTLWEEN